MFYHVAATSTNALREYPEGRKHSISQIVVFGSAIKKHYKYHNIISGRTETRSSIQNRAGFSNINDFPSNSYKHKLYRQIRNVLTTSLPIAQFACTGRYRNLYAAPSTRITWYSSSRSHCNDVRPIN
jgi:hypothetical protein